MADPNPTSPAEIEAKKNAAIANGQKGPLVPADIDPGKLKYAQEFQTRMVAQGKMPAGSASVPLLNTVDNPDAGVISINRTAPTLGQRLLGSTPSSYTLTGEQLAKGPQSLGPPGSAPNNTDSGAIVPATTPATTPAASQPAGSLVGPPVSRVPGTTFVRVTPDESGTTVYNAQATKDDPGRGDMRIEGQRKGDGGTLSVVSGPGSGKYTDEQWKAMTPEQKSQANSDYYNEAIAAYGRRNALIPKGPTLVGRGGDGGSGQMSDWDREIQMREYSMAISNLRDDLQRGRISDRKGTIIAGLLQDQYKNIFGPDSQARDADDQLRKTALAGQFGMEREGVQQEGEARRARMGHQAKMNEPETFKSEVTGEGEMGGKTYSLVGNRGTVQPILTPSQKTHMERIKAAKSPEEAAELRKQWDTQFPNTPYPG